MGWPLWSRKRHAQKTPASVPEESQVSVHWTVGQRSWVKLIGNQVWKTTVVNKNGTLETFATKIVSINPECLAESRESITREFNRMRGMRHKHIITYHFLDFDNNPPRALLDLEFCGQTLEQYVNSILQNLDDTRRPGTHRPGFMTPNLGRPVVKELLIWQWMEQIASALSYCHHPPWPRKTVILHRDLKPDNVFLHSSSGSEPVAKLGDFGFSVEIDEMNESAFRTWMGGHFVAPEIKTGNRQVCWTKECDIYSFGCVIYYMCTGSINSDLYKNPRLLDDEIPAAYNKSIRKIVKMCCCEAPTHRPDAKGLLEEIMKSQTKPWNLPRI